MMYPEEAYYLERKRWFIDRIGKVVYRNTGTCDCRICKSVEKNGLLIADSVHASYLNDVEGCSAGEPNPVRYFDTMLEAKNYETSLINGGL